jgi:LacI family transcriptional regulator
MKSTIALDRGCPTRANHGLEPFPPGLGQVVGVTIKQVAREAGVSIATVSRVLTGNGPVLASTRARILEVAQRLRYVPHVGARSLATQRTQAIGVLLPDIHGEFFSELIRGLDRTAAAREYHLLVSGSHGGRESLEALLRTMRGRVDGMIVMTPELDGSALREAVPDGVPTVTLSSPAAPGVDSIEVDDHGGAEAMVRHLASLGHRRIAFLTGPPGNRDALERLRGYRDAVRALGLPRTAALVLSGDFDEESGRRAADDLLALDPPPDAVFAANDAMALGLLSGLTERKVSVPGDLALAGFDDVPLARFLCPALTTVRVPMQQMATLAIERLFERIDGKMVRTRRHRTLPTEVIVRASCGARYAGGPNARRS